MTSRERHLYHQIHPFKMATDLAAGAGAVAALAHGWLVAGIALAVVPAAAASFAVLRHADLERLKRSRLGAYVRKYMTPAAQVQRVAGFGLLSVASWNRSYLTAVFAAALIVHAWTQGLLIPRSFKK